MSAFLFIPLLAATFIVGLALAAVAAHYFLVVLESTASGSDAVVWPEEPMTDWLWKLVYLLWLGGAWVAPLVIIGGLASPDPWVRFAFVAGSVWLLLPVGLLSSLSANSPWVPFWPGLFARLGQRPQAVFTFYLLSVPLAFGFVGSFYVVVARAETSMGLALLLAPVAAAGFLIYARAVGRLGLALSFTKGGSNEPATKKRKRKKPKEKPQTGEHDEQPVMEQPSELPPLETPFDGPVTGYDVQRDDAPREPDPEKHSRRSPDDDEDLTPIPLAAEPNDPATAQRPPAPAPPSPEEVDLWADRRIKEPERPFDASVLTFLGQPRTASAWLVLAAGLAVLGVMIRLLRELRPV